MAQTSSTEFDKLGVRQRIDTAVAAIEEARKHNRRLQATLQSSSVEWRAHESIDDHLYNALEALGS